jgi:hypothetical protein
MDDVLMELRQAAMAGPDALSSALARHSGDLSYALASAASERVDSVRDPYNLTGWLLAAEIYARLGENERALESYVNLGQARYMAADTVDEYRDTRDLALSVIETADSEGLGGVASAAAVLAADCAYYAGEASRGGERFAWRVTALEDIVHAARRISPGETGPWFVRFVDLLAVIANLIMAANPAGPDGDRVIELLHGAAVAARRLVPETFQFPGDANQTANIRSTLERLREAYGWEGAAPGPKLVIRPDQQQLGPALEFIQEHVGAGDRLEFHANATPPWLLVAGREASTILEEMKRRGVRVQAIE